MKKTIHLSFLWLFLMATIPGLTSCKKKYECHCEGPNNAHEHFEIKAKNKGEAESECAKKKTGSFTSCKIE